MLISFVTTSTTALFSCLGPLNKTTVDLWRLIWQERPPVIVMVTNLKEESKVKCQQYWPDTGSHDYGPFRVTTIEQQVYSDYVIRQLQLEVICHKWLWSYSMSSTSRHITARSLWFSMVLCFGFVVPVHNLLGFSLSAVKCPDWMQTLVVFFCFTFCQQHSFEVIPWHVHRMCTQGVYGCCCNFDVLPNYKYCVWVVFGNCVCM